MSRQEGVGVGLSLGVGMVGVWGGSKRKAAMRELLQGNCFNRSRTEATLLYLTVDHLSKYLTSTHPGEAKPYKVAQRGTCRAAERAEWHWPHHA